jgi:tellurite resistance protein TehA-like permease
LFVVACFGWVAQALALPPRAFEWARPRVESFAFVAATAVLGARLALMGQDTAALALWLLAVAAWIGILLRLPQRARPGGSRFLLVVGVESLAVLAAVLAARWGEPLLGAALACWLAGLCLYPLVATAIAAELRLRPRFAPALWITMGALAIAAVAGGELLLAARTLAALAPEHALLRDSDLVLWALASACIAPLAVADARSRAGWRDPWGRWSFVFPLGMYAVAGQVVGRAAGLEPLAHLGRICFFVALAAWAVTAVYPAVGIAGVTSRARGGARGRRGSPARRSSRP